MTVSSVTSSTSTNAIGSSVATTTATTGLNTVASTPSSANQSMTVLHQAPSTPQVAQLKNYSFKKITLEDKDLAPELIKILNRHKILSEEEYRHNKAVLSDDGNTLVMTLDGKTTLANYFGGKGAIKRFYSKTLGAIPRTFGSPNTLLGARKYKELYNPDQTAEPNGEKGESLSELIRGLYSNHYHSVVIFQKDPVTGQFEKAPKALAITDSYMMLIRANIKVIKADATEEEIKALEQRFKKYYSLDKVLPFFSMEEAQKLGIDFNEIRHKIIEGLYQAQGFDLLAVASQIDPSPNSNTNDLNYKRIECHTVTQNNNDELKAKGDPKLVTDTTFSTASEKEEYLKNLQSQNRSTTIVRPIAEANKPLPKELALLDGISQMSSGTKSRVSEKDFKLIQQAAKVNGNTLATQAA